MYSLHVIPRAQKDLDRLPSNVFPRALQALEKLKEDPRGHGSIKLTGEEGYRVRFGDYRILYRIDDQAKKIFVYRIKHRREACR